MSDRPFNRRDKRRTSLRRRNVVFPTFEEIAERTYELFIDNGRHVDRVFDYWQQAEDELLDRAASLATR